MPNHFHNTCIMHGKNYKLKLNKLNMKRIKKNEKKKHEVMVKNG